MRTDHPIPQKAPPPPAAVRAALTRPGEALRATVIPMAEANVLATELGGCIGSLRGDRLAICVTDGTTQERIALAVCTSPASPTLADPHTTELRCLLVDRDYSAEADAVWVAVQAALGARGYRRLLSRNAAARPDRLASRGWAKVCGDGRGFADGRSALWFKVLRGERR
jgi:hypothetical protein